VPIPRKPDVAINEANRLIAGRRRHYQRVYASSHAVPSGQVEQKKILITTAVSTACSGQNLQNVFVRRFPDQYGGPLQLPHQHAGKRDRARTSKCADHEDGPYGVGVAAADEAIQAGRTQVVLGRLFGVRARPLGA
jgi:branched-chain amino acid transport system substrate-binding protein